MMQHQADQGLPPGLGRPVAQVSEPALSKTTLSPYLHRQLLSKAVSPQTPFLKNQMPWETVDHVLRNLKSGRRQMRTLPQVASAGGLL